MKRVGISALFCLVLSALWGGGIVDLSDPLEKVENGIDLQPFSTLILKGEMEVYISTGEKASIQWSTSKALLSQLSFFNWYGTQFISLETGLMGPRERGSLRLEITIPTSLEVLEIQEGVNLETAYWSHQGVLKIGVKDKSQILANLDVLGLILETTWNSKAEIRGLALDTRLIIRDGSTVKAEEWDSPNIEVEMRDAKAFVGGRPKIRGNIKKSSLLHIEEADIQKVEIWDTSEIEIISHNLQTPIVEP